MEINVCKFCGQTFVDGDPVEVCDCYDAKRYRRQKEQHDRYCDGIERLFGVNCTELERSWCPIETEQIEALKSVAGSVAFGLIEAASVKLADGSTCSINGAGVKRSIKLSREEK